MTPTISDADFLWKLMAGLSLLLNFGAAIAVAWNRMSGKSESREISPSPLPVMKADRFVTEKQLEPLVERINGHEEEIAQLRDTIVLNYNTIMKSDSEARSRLHREINDLANKVSNLTGIVEPLKGMAERFAKDVGRLEGILQRNQ